MEVSASFFRLFLQLHDIGATHLVPGLEGALMETMTPIMPPPPQSPLPGEQPTRPDDAWVANVALLWTNRHLLARVLILTIIISTLLAFLLPKQYESTTRIMPPEQSGGSAAMLAAVLSGRTSGGGGLA